MERTSLSRFFSLCIGLSFRDFICRYRVNVAMDLLARSEESVTDIAFAVGFGSLSAFERTFAKPLGTTAWGYRKSMLSVRMLRERARENFRLRVRSLHTNRRRSLRPLGQRERSRLAL